MTIGHLKKSHERHSPLRADAGGSGEVLGTVIGMSSKQKDATISSCTLLFDDS